MIAVLPLKPKVIKLLTKHPLSLKFNKQINLLTNNPKHPSLHVALLEPKEYGIYSFRIDRKYRALFIAKALQTTGY